ncbi:MAG: NAD(P)H-dependent oxidoreductase subunit E [Bacteroidales bacterium]|nr:NAD(P)H-dependent oxidoreductase subunit E [Bacteroidales bacterium]MCF8456107.1 NAD(P)H-dependent oxidoreductase subunit E [Bacteroidales bacterium]
MKHTYNISSIIEEQGKSKSDLIPILQAIQNKFNYLPEELLREVCERTEITPSEILGIASFYSQFRLKPVGEHRVKICVGTACHVKGASLIYDAFRREMKLKEGEDTDASGNYTLEKVSCLGCCTLAPVVQINHITYGHVATEQISKIFADYEIQKDKKDSHPYRKANGQAIKGEIRIGLGSCCVASGSDDIRQEIETSLMENKLDVSLKHVGCVGMCHQVPLVEIEVENQEPILYAKVKPEEISAIVQKHFQANTPFGKLKRSLTNSFQKLQYGDEEEGIERYLLDVREKHVSSFLNNQIPIATEFRGVINPTDIDEYKFRSGLKAMRRALKLSSKEIIDEIRKSGLRGRGGAGFSTAAKWELVAGLEADEKYIICNGDEGDPGAFMDRMLLESYPYRIIEGILIAAKAVGAHKAIFYIRAEYPLAVQRVQKALEICRERGYLGKNILKSGFSFDIEIVQGAGAFVCGEETALIASIEGRRGFPRIRPPYPAEHGLWGKPTLVNNTETFAQISYILSHGAEKFFAIGTENSKGTKVFSLAGKVMRGGLIEVPMGMTINEIVNEIGGGVANDKQFKAVQIGGPSGGCVPHWLGDMQIDYQSLQEAGAMMGSGGLVVLDESDCMVDIARYFLSFTQSESCGKCTFCRVGTKRMLEILTRICEGQGLPSDLTELEELSGWVKKGSLCGLGKTAPNPVLSTLQYFRDEYEAHINGHCPSGKCQALITYSINDNCIGCTLCAQKCPMDAIAFTPHEKHIIDTEKCIKCDSCRQVCPEGAVVVE